MLAYRNNVFLVPASVVKQDKVVFLRVPTGVSKQELKKKSVPIGVGNQE